MPKYNRNIKLWLSGNDQEPLSFFAFNKMTEAKAVDRFVNKFILRNKWEFPLAIIYINGEPKYYFTQGIRTEKPCTNWYGKNVSAFKMKLILTDNSFIGPFYSNSLIVDKSQQFHGFVEEYCYKYNGKLASMQVYENYNGTERLFATATFKNNNIKLKII